jgi:hypothetical protein
MFEESEVILYGNHFSYSVDPLAGRRFADVAL